MRRPPAVRALATGARGSYHLFMWRRHLALAFAILLVSDIAAPFAPGAFQFDLEKSLEVAQSRVVRSPALAARPFHPPNPRLENPVIPAEVFSRRPGDVPQAMELRRVPVSRQAARGEPDSLPSEDH